LILKIPHLEKHGFSKKRVRHVYFLIALILKSGSSLTYFFIVIFSVLLLEHFCILCTRRTFSSAKPFWLGPKGRASPYIRDMCPHPVPERT
jgi:hypothetical protein